MIEVGTSTWRQINGSVCRSSIQTVAISFTLCDAVFTLASLMLPVWQVEPGNSRPGAFEVVDIRMVEARQHQVFAMVALVDLQFNPPFHSSTNHICL